MSEPSLTPSQQMNIAVTTVREAWSEMALLFFLYLINGNQQIEPPAIIEYS